MRSPAYFPNCNLEPLLLAKNSYEIRRSPSLLLVRSCISMGSVFAVNADLAVTLSTCYNHTSFPDPCCTWQTWNQYLTRTCCCFDLPRSSMMPCLMNKWSWNFLLRGLTLCINFDTSLHGFCKEVLCVMC